jgi:hypothetical protein
MDEGEDGEIGAAELEQVVQQLAMTMQGMDARLSALDGGGAPAGPGGPPPPGGPPGPPPPGGPPPGGPLPPGGPTPEDLGLPPDAEAEVNAAVLSLGADPSQV